MSVRAEILTTGNLQVKGASLIINAPAGDIFNLLANPRQHSLIDGSHTVKSLHFGPDRLSLGQIRNEYEDWHLLSNHQYCRGV